MTFGKFCDGVNCFNIPVDVCFNGPKDTNVAAIYGLTGVDPFAPVVVSVNAACVLKGDSKGGGLVLSGDGG